MNLKPGPHHNIWTGAGDAENAPSAGHSPGRRRGEAGYTLVALLALMTVLALYAAAAAPSIKQQMVREREQETIFRGEEVAEGIRRYYSYMQTRVGNGDAALPTSMDQLAEGVSVGTKKVQVVRRSALKDPLSNSGEWHQVQPRSNELSDFVSAVMLYASDQRPPTNDPQLKQVELLMAPPVIPTSGLSTASGLTGITSNADGPFIGVSSEDKTKSILYYYGIDHHDGWIFTPLFR